MPAVERDRDIDRVDPCFAIVEQGRREQVREAAVERHRRQRDQARRAQLRIARIGRIGRALLGGDVEVVDARAQRGI